MVATAEGGPARPTAGSSAQPDALYRRKYCGDTKRHAIIEKKT